MKIFVKFPTGNWYENGDPEIGRIEEHEVEFSQELDDILDEIPEGVKYFVSDEDGNELNLYELCKELG